MKISDRNPPGEHESAIVRGHIGPLAAAGSGLTTVTGGGTTVNGITGLSFSGLEVIDGGSTAVVMTKWKIPCRVATTTAGTLASSFEAGDTVDGVTLAAGDRILIKDQASAIENGIYIVAASGAPNRSSDADDGYELLGAVVYVFAGTLNASTIFACTNATEPTLGTDAVNWATVTGSSGTSPGGYPWKSVKDYGAVGDGTTNDTTAIQAAIDDCADYETLFFPVGAYKITSVLTISAPIRLLGASADPNWFHQASYIYQTTANTGALTCTDFEGELQVESMGIVGAAVTARTAASGRGIYTAANLRLKGVQVQGFYDGVYIDDSLGALASSAYYNHVENCWIHYNTNAGLLLHDQVNNTIVRETYFAFNKYGVFADGGPWGLRIEGSSFELHDTSGIRINGTGASQSTSGVQISGCYFEQLNSSVPLAVADIQLGPTSLVYGTLIEGCMFVASDITALWHIDATYSISTVLAGNHFGTNSEAGSFRFNSTNSSHVLSLNNYIGGTVSTPATTRFVDATDITPVAVNTANAVGTSKWFARGDHVHEGAPYGADYLVGTAQAGLSSEIVVGTSPGGELGGTWASPTVDTTHSGSSHDDAIATAEAYTDAAVAAAAGHTHVVSETHLSDGASGLYTLDQNFEPGSVIAWNVTTLARLTVTETAPDQATVSGVGASGDSIVFDYAASLS